MQGPDGFTAGLAACGANPTIANQQVIYVVQIVEGRFAGELVETAISLDELARWPLVPPHWVYLRETVKFPTTHTQGCAMPDWLGHPAK